MNKIFIGIALALFLLAAFFWFNNYIYNKKQAPLEARPLTGQGGVANYKEVEFRMSGEVVQLQNGEARTQEVMGAASHSVVRYFGNEAKGDLNGDGVSDMAFLITQESGGSGTFFYAVGAIQNAAGRFQGTDAVLIDDRIAPQSTEIRDGILVVNYADRAPTDPMSAQPSVGKTLYLKLDPQTLQFGEVVQGFEGETGMGPRRKAAAAWLRGGVAEIFGRKLSVTDANGNQ